MTRLVLVVFLIGCSVSCAKLDYVTSKEIEITIEKAFPVDIPSSFQILEQKEIHSLFGDYSLTYQIKFSEKDFKKFIENIDLKEWGNAYPVDLFSLEKRPDDRTLYSISLYPRERTLTYLHVYD